ncbi:hypothetical protein BTA51_08740 [Hahella sp. CCB-MM4]|uniref:hypothetical protein n=1 Tax=Hahella sp. (strain CCB-MM4) TaxID=1926491 RepID=UPI000B9C375F|nr:hypothetical protein [Hahella sp. CCB-MM4]OZG73865.1 hypothetical protein BTA51_08740 [Hahella sp. CCB-MM4]
MKSIAGGVVAALLVLVTGCSTTYSHFGRFHAENSAGEAREFLLEWETTEGMGGEASSNFTLKTQCSARTLVFMSQMDQEKGCIATDGSEVLLCAQPDLDLTMEGRPVTNGSMPCGSIRGENNITRPENFGKTVELNIFCFPAETTVDSGEEKQNVDYLKASVVPYVVAVKKVVKGSGEDRPPVLNSKACPN